MLAFSPDGRMLATASKDKTCVVYNLTNGVVIRTIT
jgi:WD40 repeat protein